MTLDTESTAEESYVGIFWLLGGKLVSDRIPTRDGERYGDFRVYGRSHCSKWKKFQQRGTVALDLEYDELPRGRVSYNMKARTCILLADRCILKEKDLVAKIKKEFQLPPDIKGQPDLHYRCPRCLVPWHAATADF